MACNQPVPVGEECPACGKAHKDFSKAKQVVIFTGIGAAIITVIYLYFHYRTPPGYY